MFDSVIHARDKYLSKNGYLFPNIATLYIAGASHYCNNTDLEDLNQLINLNENQRFVDKEQNIAFLTNLKALVKTKADVDIVDSDRIITD